MKKLIIIINGKGGCGKDTLVKFVQSQYERYEVWNISAIDPIKEIAKPYGYSENNKDEKWRKALSLLKEAFILIDNIPLKYLLRKTEAFLESDDKIMFVHIREPYEIDKFKLAVKDMFIYEKEFRLNTLLIKREDTDNKVYGNKSDDEVDNYNYDFVFTNKDGEDIDKYKFMIYFKKQILPMKNGEQSLKHYL